LETKDDNFEAPDYQYISSAGVEISKLVNEFQKKMAEKNHYVVALAFVTDNQEWGMMVDPRVESESGVFDRTMDRIAELAKEYKETFKKPRLPVH
jgi:hypothetical protein